jgi:hypothetical protein
MTEEVLDCEIIEKTESTNTKRWDQLYELVSTMVKYVLGQKDKTEKKREN